MRKAWGKVKKAWGWLKKHFTKPLTTVGAPRLKLFAVSGAFEVPWNIALFDETGKLKDGDLLTVTGSVSLPSLTASAAAASTGVGITIDTIADITLSVGGTHDMSQYISNPQSEPITTSMTGLDPFHATYSDTTKLLSGVLETTAPLTGVTLEVETAGWQLDAGHYYEAISWPTTPYASQAAGDTAPYVIHPRPHTETQSHARHRWAHPSMDYEIPICVRGGAFPYYMEIDAANTSAALTSISIAATYDSTDSYVVSIPAATIAGLSASTPYDVYVKITDQAGKEIKCWWTLEKDDGTNFIFVDNSYAGGSNDGSYSTPFTDLLDTDAGATNVFTGTGINSLKKIVVIKQGNSQTTPYTKSDNWFADGSGFPRGIINIPGETPKIDLQNQYVVFGATTGSDDIFVRGLECVNGANASYQTSEGHGNFNRDFGSHARMTITDTVFDTINSFGASSKNPGAIRTGSTGSLSTYLSIVDCTFKNFVGVSSAESNTVVMHLMGFKWCLIDSITCQNIGTTNAGLGAIVYPKHSMTDFTVRRVTAIDNVRSFGGFIESNDTFGPTYKMQEVECCYNNFKNTTTGNYTIMFPGSEPGAGNQYVYRNTANDSGFYNIIVWDADLYGDWVCLNNVGGGSLYSPSAKGNKTEANNYMNEPTSSYNADNTLKDSWYTTNGETRGTIGHEIA